MSRNLLILVFFAVWASCQNQDQRTSLLPLYDGLSKYHRPISTNSKEAQDYFDQGLALYYGFNHEAAILSFQQALALDSNCVMAWWGQAISSGPNINNTEMDDHAKIAAWESIVKAQNQLDKASAFEARLINALTKRYTWPAPDDRRSLDLAYAEAMKEAYDEFPDDVDVAVLYADAMMNLRPWDLWTSEGIPQPGTGEIVTILERVLEKQPDHPGACHFYIHTMEASPYFEKALPAARLSPQQDARSRSPGSYVISYPIPSDPDEDAITANLKAIEADHIWISSGGFYTVYRAHNHHFLAYAAMFDGQKELALSASEDLIDAIPLEVVRAYPDFLDGFIAVPTHVMVRFGMWMN